MRIRSLSLQNYRGFAECSLDFGRPITVLAGVNGAGKSSVLTALATIFSYVLAHVEPSSRLAGRLAGWRLEELDIHIGAEALLVRAEIRNGDQEAPVELRLAKGAPREGQLFPNGSVSMMTRVSPCLPVFYTAGRRVAAGAAAFATPALPAGVSAPLRVASPQLYDAMDPGGHAVEFSSFFRWFKDREDVENEERVKQKNLTLEDPQLAAVRRAVGGMLAGFMDVRIQRDPLHMLVRKGDTELAIDQLSDGEKLLLAMTADLARRLSLMYVALPDPLKGEAVVLIDELEQHLHPRWQRTVLPNLRTTFPNCQFIVTTHSPLVIGSVAREAVVVLEGFQVVHPASPTKGRDANAILAEVMGVSERPDDVAQKLAAIGAKLDNDDFDGARAMLHDLDSELGSLDAEVVRLRTRLEFLEHPLQEDLP